MYKDNPQSSLTSVVVVRELRWVFLILLMTFRLFDCFQIFVVIYIPQRLQFISFWTSVQTHLDLLYLEFIPILIWFWFFYLFASTFWFTFVWLQSQSSKNSSMVILKFISVVQFIYNQILSSNHNSSKTKTMIIYLIPISQNYDLSPISIKP